MTKTQKHKIFPCVNRIEVELILGFLKGRCSEGRLKTSLNFISGNNKIYIGIGVEHWWRDADRGWADRK